MRKSSKVEQSSLWYLRSKDTIPFWLEEFYGMFGTNNHVQVEIVSQHFLRSTCFLTRLPFQCIMFNSSYSDLSQLWLNLFHKIRWVASTEFRLTNDWQAGASIFHQNIALQLCTSNYEVIDFSIRRSFIFYSKRGSYSGCSSLINTVNNRSIHTYIITSNTMHHFVANRNVKFMVVKSISSPISRNP